MKPADQAEILCVCGDPGGAAALVPVIHLLMNDASVRIHLFAYYQAEKVFGENGLGFSQLQAGLTIEDARQQLTDLEIDLLVTGTSANDLELEKKWIAAANVLQTPSLAVLDFWANYAKRFSWQENDLGCLPSRIAVMDQFAKQEMILEGIPKESIVVAGQPAFDHLYQKRRTFLPEDKAVVRDHYSLGPDDLMVVFVSQPLSSMLPKNDPETALGYDERDALIGLASVVSDICAEKENRAQIIIIPHLRETETWWEVLQFDHVKITSGAGMNFVDTALAADLVTGITSTRLVEAAILGCKTLSLQFNAKETRRFDMERLGIAKNLFTTQALKEQLKSGFLSGSAAWDDRTYAGDGKAASRVCDLIHQMLSEPDLEVTKVHMEAAI